ncbi:hypothetical protein ACFQX6_22775 [Streptosporangium lutulentum]
MAREKRKTLEERIADRQAQRPALKRAAPSSTDRRSSCSSSSLCSLC